jgi:hypothetical protein
MLRAEMHCALMKLCMGHPLMKAFILRFDNFPQFRW